MADGHITALIDDLDRRYRSPRLVDVALDGPRFPSAIRVMASSPDGVDAVNLLDRRLMLPAERDGRWLPAGEHLVETYEALLELAHDDTEQDPIDRATTPSESADRAHTPASLVEPPPPEAVVEPGLSTSAGSANLQSLTEELAALRGELARATHAETAALAERDELARERDVLRATRDDHLKQLGSVRQRRRDAEAELTAARDELAELQARADASASSELSADRLDRIARAASSIASRESLSPDDEFVLERLHSAVPEDPRVGQAYGVVLSRNGRHEPAFEVLSGFDRTQLSRAASLSLLRSGIALGVLPEDAKELVATIRPSGEEIQMLASLAGGLASGRVFDLTRELLNAVPDEEMAAWFTTVVNRLTGRPLIGVLELWAAIEPDRSLQGLVTALDENRLTTNDSGAATLALDLDWLTLGEDEVRDMAHRLASSLTRGRDIDGLYRVLTKIDYLAMADRHVVGTELVHAIAQIAPDKEPITDALDVAIRFVEDHRQANRISDAVRLAGFVRQNLHRADEDTQALAEFVLADLDRAVANSAIGQRLAEELDREELADVRRAVEGKRFLLVGGQRQAWYDELREQLRFSGDSEWRESSRAEPPSMRQLKAVVKAGRLDGVFVFTDFVAHKTSAIKETAGQYSVPYLEAKMSKQGLIDAFRTWAARHVE